MNKISTEREGKCDYFPKITPTFLMRVSLVYSLLILFSIQFISAKSTGQSIETTRITIEAKHESLGTVLRKIEAKTEFKFIVDYELQEKHTGITIEKGERSVKEILDVVMGQTGLTYKEGSASGSIVIVDRPQVGSTATEESVMEESVMVATISGAVRDKNNVPMPGVNVVVKGTTKGTTTDTEGRYVIDAKESDVLVFSFIGFKAVEEKVGTRTTIDLTMEEDATTLQAVDIIGTNYFTTTREKSTMNIAKIDGKNIENQPITSPLMALQGRMAGVDVTPYNGAAGSAVKIQIRGNNSLRWNGGYPLYVIDGVQIDSRPLESASNSLIDNGFDPLSTINPNDIESIEVLKDAAATSIYGSRGANGVVRITTKQASRSGTTNLDLSVYSGVGEIPNRVKLLNTSQYIEMRREAFLNDGLTGPGEFEFDINTWDTTRYTDWQKELLGGSANITDVQLGLSGGNYNTTFRIGGGFHKENVIYHGDFGFKRANVNLSFNHTSPNQKLIITFSTNYGWNRNNLFDSNNFIRYALTTQPNAPRLYDESGQLNWELVSLFDGTFEYHSWDNPLASLKRTHETVSKNLFSSATFSYEISNGLFLKANVGYNELNSSEILKNPIESVAPYFRPYQTGTGIFGNNARTSIIVEPQITYSKTIGHSNIDIVIGSTWQQMSSLYKSVEGSGYTTDALLNTIRGAKEVRFLNDDNTEYRYGALFCRIGYSFNNKYIVDITGRRDGSSRFGPGNRYGNFGALGAAWIFSQENLFKNGIGFLSFGKVRASVGTTGNDQIGDYQFYNTFSIAPYGYDNAISLYPSSLYNPDFAWEKTSKIEAAIELGLFDNRLMIDGAWYRNRSANQLIEYHLPAITGFLGVLSNFNAVIENAGLEVNVSVKNIIKGDFKWLTSLNFSLPNNKLVEFDGLSESSYSSMYKVGEPLSIQRLYTYKGVNPETGLYEVVDITGDSAINEEDMQFMKPIGRKYYGGVLNTFSFKGIELSFLLQFSKSSLFDHLPAVTPGRPSNITAEVFNNSWREEGDVSKYSKFSQSSDNSAYYDTYVRWSDYNTHTSSYLRLKTLTLSYNLPAKIINRIKLQSAKIFFQGQNLFTITNFPGFDPETGNSLPPLRVVSVGFQSKI